MSAKTPKSESTPIKRLVLRREKVRDMHVRTGVKTGSSGEGLSSSGPVVPSATFSSHIKGASDPQA
jgi:hypothetical protein